MVLSNLEDAGDSLQKLAAAADAGEEVLIARGGKPAFRLVPVEAAAPGSAIDPKLDFRIPDQFKGQIWMSDDFDDEMTGFDGDDEDGAGASA